MNQCIRSKYVSTSKAAVSRGGSRESSSVATHLDPSKEGFGGRLEPLPVLVFTAGISDSCGSWPPGIAVVMDVSGVAEL